MTPFNIPNLPTDNLYKFYSITGIAICVFTISFFLVSWVKLFDGYESVNAALDIGKIEQEFNLLESKELEILIDKVDKELKKNEIERKELKEAQLKKPITNSDSSLNDYDRFIDRQVRLMTDKDYREFQKFQFDYEEHLFPRTQKIEKIQILKKSLFASERKRRIKVSEINSTLNQLKRKRVQLIILTFVSVFFLIFGYRLASRGFHLWKTKVQDKIDKKLELELELINEDFKNLTKNKNDNSN